MMQKDRFAGGQETRFHPAKSSQMCIAVPQMGRFVDDQESRTQFERRSDMGIAVTKGLHFGDTK